MRDMLSKRCEDIDLGDEGDFVYAATKPTVLMGYGLLIGVVPRLILKIDGGQYDWYVDQDQPSAIKTRAAIPFDKMQYVVWTGAAEMADDNHMHKKFTALPWKPCDPHHVPKDNEDATTTLILNSESLEAVAKIAGHRNQRKAAAESSTGFSLEAVAKTAVDARSGFASTAADGAETDGGMSGV
eukprot:gnl/TRDRNA2_/TRDRNA2_151629_c0_seq1.p1 gnl/TRDRNA2_/TRDRNA2_151629_c0~~gnl/TRDRNA2_/TRDRNA2_151629_c0_seq1.p1  ORF type:complete len:184 (+),score=22.52 gnl/TRDRNA2_/TRDRNA2_151629_c0_seq1:76-627(+)